MPVWLIVLLVGIVLEAVFIFLCAYFSGGHSSLDWGTEDLLSGIFLFFSIVTGAALFIGTPIIGVAEKEYDYVQYENIYSVRGTNDNVEGSFFLGTGTIDEDTYYVVFVEDEKYIKLNKYNVENTFIVEVETGDNYVRCIKEKWSMNDCYILYVPKGTIVVEYRI